MSAYVVDRRHIDALVRVALEGPADRAPEYPGDAWSFSAFYADVDGELERFEVRRETADDLGRMLWVENVRSVAYRYPADGPNDRPGPIGFTDAEAEAYAYPRFPLGPPRHLTTGEALKAADGLDYQSCETLDWRSTPAAAFLTALREHVIATMPAYRDAETWEVTR